MEFTMAQMGTKDYSWMWEATNPLDAARMTDEDIYAMIDVHIEQARDDFENEIEERAAAASYPQYGYTTADVLESEEEFIAYYTEDMEEQLKSERETMFAEFKSWKDNNNPILQ